MDTIPADVKEAAREALATQYPRHADDYRSGRNDFLGDWQAACRAILAERERCAKIAAEWKSPLRPGTEARLLGHQEAAREIAKAIEASK